MAKNLQQGEKVHPPRQEKPVEEVKLIFEPKEKEFEEAPQVEDYRPKGLTSNALMAQLQAKDQDLKAKQEVIAHGCLEEGLDSSQNRTITLSALLELAKWNDGLQQISADIHHSLIILGINILNSSHRP
uniref:Uncharacterized protein n=1 Tax=Romanomermis culicivorax TaxID=13658 RepID=A0A915KM25_ROMCU